MIHLSEILEFSPVDDFALQGTFGNIWKYFWLVTSGRLLLASERVQARKLLTILPCTGQPHSKARPDPKCP